MKCAGEAIKDLSPLRVLLFGVSRLGEQLDLHGKQRCERFAAVKCASNVLRRMDSHQRIHLKVCGSAAGSAQSRIILTIQREVVEREFAMEGFVLGW